MRLRTTQDSLQILYLRPPGIGWQSVTHFSLLAAELLEAELTTVDWVNPGQLARKLGALIPERKGAGKTLVIAPHPEHLLGVVGFRRWLSGSAFTAALVTDSFWVERIPRMLGKAGHYDHIFVHDGELVDSWAHATGLPVSWLPVGSDVLRFGSDNPDRPLDLLRIGRQPPAWDDDEFLISKARAAGVTASGRPPMFEDARLGYPNLMLATQSAKFTLAFGSRVNPTPYTHPKREMLTYRWTDAIAAGTVVAGVPPINFSASELLWPEALLEISPTDVDSGLEEIRREASSWKPSRARNLYVGALQRIDWRWRLREIAKVMEIDAPILDGEIQQIEQMLAASESSI